jgi:putative transposase
VVDFINHWRSRTGLPTKIFLRGLGIRRERFYQWELRYGKKNEHNGLIPKEHQISDAECQRIIGFYNQNSLDGYRRLTYLMIDRDVAYVAPSTTYRVLLRAGLIRHKQRKISKKGTGFVHPLAPHQHWHVDITYIKICGVFYYLILVLDGYSRFIVSWDLREKMTEADVEIVIQKGLEAFPGVTPRIISDNGAQFTCKEFKEFLKVVGMSHVRTSPYYPQSNGKLERCNKTLKEFLIAMCIADYEDGKRILGAIIHDYNTERLHSSIGYVTPKDKLYGDDVRILAERKAKIERAKAERKANRRKE